MQTYLHDHLELEKNFSFSFETGSELFIAGQFIFEEILDTKLYSILIIFKIEGLYKVVS